MSLVTSASVKTPKFGREALGRRYTVTASSSAGPELRLMELREWKSTDMITALAIFGLPILFPSFALAAIQSRSRGNLHVLKLV
jgi:hypothetical protein